MKGYQSRFQVTGDPSLADANSEVKLWVSGSLSPTIMAAFWRLDPMAIYMQAWAMAGVAAILSGMRKKQITFSAKSFALMLILLNHMPCLLIIRSATRSGSTACAIPGACHLTGKQGISSSVTWAERLEEIDYLLNSGAGTNFGWDYREGAHDYEGGGPAGLVDPIAEYSHPKVDVL
jgi:hypothetical protein